MQIYLVDFLEGHYFLNIQYIPLLAVFKMYLENSNFDVPTICINQMHRKSSYYKKYTNVYVYFFVYIILNLKTVADKQISTGVRISYSLNDHRVSKWGLNHLIFQNLHVVPVAQHLLVL